MSATLPVDERHRDVIDARGEEVVTYLQGQLSQDVGDLAVGQPVWSLLLEPTGKLGWWIRVTRLDEPDHLSIDVEAGVGEEVLARLNRFKLRSRVTFELQASESTPADGGDDDLEVARIEAGVPRAGAEIVDGVIPAELGQWLIDASVSFTKGCYTGQELVARIDSRGGNVPRQLRGLVLADDHVPSAGAEVLVGDDVVGTVTSAARSPGLGAPVALSLVARRVEVPSPANIRDADGLWPAEIRALPLVGVQPA